MVGKKPHPSRSHALLVEGTSELKYKTRATHLC